jgi:hypothetical protein
MQWIFNFMFIPSVAWLVGFLVVIALFLIVLLHERPRLGGSSLNTAYRTCYPKYFLSMARFSWGYHLSLSSAFFVTNLWFCYSQRIILLLLIENMDVLDHWDSETNLVLSLLPQIFCSWWCIAAHEYSLCYIHLALPSKFCLQIFILQLELLGKSYSCFRNLALMLVRWWRSWENQRF